MMLNSFDSKGKAGAVFVVLGILLLIAGMIGYTFTGEIEDVPTPTATNQAFFADEPLPENVLSPFVSAEVTITWDRDDVWIGLVDEDEKKRCEDVPTYFANGVGCDGSSIKLVAGDSTASASDGFTWKMESGTYYAALGAKDSGIPAGSQVLVEYTVDLGHSLLSVLISVGAVFIGAVLMYYGRE